jgi:hypothetical protein
LQALVMLNDPVYFEAATAMAKHMIASQPSLDARIKYGARLVLSRDPTNQELTALRALYQETMATPTLIPAAARAHGSARDLDAMTAVASVLINLDAALTR